MNYEKRLLKFLAANQHLNLTYREIAALWKRNHNDVWYAAQALFQQGKIKMKCNVLVLK